MCLSYYWDFSPTLPDYKSGALPTELRRLISKVKTIIYQAICPRIEHLAFSRLRQHLDSAKPIFGIFLSPVPTQHLIAPIPQPSRDDRCMSSLGLDPIVDDPTDVGLFRMQAAVRLATCALRQCKSGISTCRSYLPYSSRSSSIIR